ncbi:sensor histidine kinase [Nitrososphaera sp.]|uniref:sensor histidine kinase n=1 Tax=Nitrososphaera sp. TaxID=1971748 RepID=UPI0017B9F6C3|nr:sensor histidine kinase [Nitrososphaera sp.]NWG37700.1 sensor histidine kinase [Nitrososphaera sp.]
MFTFAILVSIISIGTLSAVAYFRAEALIQENARHALKAIVDDRARAITGISDSTLRQVSAAAQETPAQKLLLAHYLEGTEYALAPGERASLEEEFLYEGFNRFTTGSSVAGGYYEISMADENGTVFLGTSPLLGATIDDAAVFPEGLERAFYLLEFDDERQEPEMIVVSPVRSVFAGEEYRGMLVVTRDINTLHTVLGDHTNLGQTGETYIVGRDGIMLSPSRFVSEVPVRVDTLAVRECFDNRVELEGVQYADYRGVSVYGASKCIPELGIVVIAEQDAQEVLSPIFVLQDDFMLLTAGVMAATVMVAILMSQRFTTPLRQLLKHMKKVENGTFEPITEQAADEEYRIVHQNFNRMVEVIKSSTEKVQSSNKELIHLNGELVKASLRLHEIDREKEEFSAMITHELKTPLVAILGYSELLLDGSLGELTPQQKEKVGIVADAANSLTLLISNILDAHKLELGEIKFAFKVTRAADLVRTSVNHNLQKARKRNVRIDDLSDSGASLRCDMTRIVQVLDNLVDNAIKFVPENTGFVEVSAKQNDGSVTFAVRDNGIGIPKEKQADLFKRFYQVDTSLSRKTGGSGLGLAISKGIVEAHGGRIWVESDSGKGTTFYFTVPANATGGGE